LLATVRARRGRNSATTMATQPRGPADPGRVRTHGHRVAGRTSASIGLPGVEPQGGGVDAVPESRRFRTVVKDVSQVRAAVRALDLDAPHEEAGVGDLLHPVLLHRRPEARPAGPRVELCPRGEEFVTADHARVHAVPVVVPILPREGPLGPLVYTHIVLERREACSDLGPVELRHRRETRRLSVKVSAVGSRQPASPRRAGHVAPTRSSSRKRSASRNLWTSPSHPASTPANSRSIASSATRIRRRNR